MGQVKRKVETVSLGEIVESLIEAREQIGRLEAQQAELVKAVEDLSARSSSAEGQEYYKRLVERVKG